MNENLINDIGNKVHKLRSVTVTNNYSDRYNLDLLVQNLMTLQRVLINNKQNIQNDKQLAILDKEIKYFLTRYSK